MLKKIILRHFTLFMALLVLSSSTGIGLVENHCMMRGKSVSLIFKDKKKGCKLCSAPKKDRNKKDGEDGPVLKKSHCCLEKHQLKHVDYQAPASKSLENSLKIFPAAVPPAFAVAAFLKPELSDHRGSNSPPVSFTSRHYGRTTLSFIQSYLI